MAWLTTTQIQQIDEIAPVSNFIKLNKLPEGKECRFRAFGGAITGYLGWTEPDSTSPYGKPIRWELKPLKLPSNLQLDEKTGQPRLQFFVASVFYDYTNQMFGVMEVTQKTVYERFKGLESDVDYGDLTTYDVKVTRRVQNDRTSYEIMPSPPKPVASEIAEAYKAFYCDLQALYAGEDPFKDPSKA